ncbi:Anther-specific protein agp1-like protein [Hirschfeldia incana]|nr:Anther-specific protein agp1-like protein [Hirschfeldia incana]
MARLHLVLLLLFIAVSTVVSATDKPSVTTAGPPTATAPTSGDVEAAEAPGDDNAIGTTDDDAPGTPGDDDVAVAGPVGSETSYANYPPPQQTSGSGVTAMIGFVSVAATTVGSFFFF